MVRIITFCCALIGLWGCSAGTQIDRVPAEMTREIPSRAETMVVKSTLPAGELYEKLQAELVNRGFVLGKQNRASYTLATDYNRLQGGLQLKVSASINDMGGFSVMRVSGTWKPGSSSQYYAGQRGRGTNFDMGNSRKDRRGPKPAKWDSGPAREAFGEVVMIGSALPHASVSYER